VYYNEIVVWQALIFGVILGAIGNMAVVRFKKVFIDSEKPAQSLAAKQVSQRKSLNYKSA
jgi:hypothetical protein